MHIWISINTLPPELIAMRNPFAHDTRRACWSWIGAPEPLSTPRFEKIAEFLRGGDVLVIK
jgi:hypothetical protein